MTKSWNDYSPLSRPWRDCEAFVLAEVVEEHSGLQKGEFIIQSDCYNADQDRWLECDGEFLKVHKWQTISFPKPPRSYKKATSTVIHQFA